MSFSNMGRRIVPKEAFEGFPVPNIIAGEKAENHL